jgi:hypothetical protein
MGKFPVRGLPLPWLCQTGDSSFVSKSFTLVDFVLKDLFLGALRVKVLPFG